MARRIEAVVLNHDDHEATLRAVRELAGSRGVRVDVLVVDAASRPDDVAALRRAVDPDRLLALPENRGYAGGMNAGLAFWRREGAGAPVLLLTPDARVDGDAARRLLDALEAGGRVGAVGPVVAYSTDPAGRIGAGGDILPGRARVRLSTRVRRPDPYDVDWIEGCCMLLRPGAVEAVGGFDEAYFLYFEEIDLCHRLREAGWSVRVVPGAAVLHPKAAGGLPPRYFYYMTRNAYRFWRKNFGLGPWRPALESLRATLWLGIVALGAVLLPTRWSQARARLRDFRRQLGGAWAGTVDSLRSRTGARAPRRPRR
ncbi:MAG TPA: glycosyltransferase family 2 protein [Longimicrobiales bacterium]|nr:glycosyltransferase family 2 protein [Longimicrobiales bacterium]